MIQQFNDVDNGNIEKVDFLEKFSKNLLSRVS